MKAIPGGAAYRDAVVGMNGVADAGSEKGRLFSGLFGTGSTLSDTGLTVKKVIGQVKLKK
jgi:hypothetical protein